MENKFTPGPWEWSERSKVSEIPSSLSNTPFSIHKAVGRSAVMPIADIVNFPPASVEQTDVQRANARLIAAAPEMYTLLKEFDKALTISPKKRRSEVMLSLSFKASELIKKATE